MAMVTGPAPSLRRSLANSMILSRSIWLRRKWPISSLSLFREYAFERRSGLRTSSMSAMWRSTRSATVFIRSGRCLETLSPRSTRRSILSAHSSASLRRRNDWETYRPLRRTCARQLPEGSFVIDDISCALRVHRGIKTGTNACKSVHTNCTRSRYSPLKLLKK